MKRFILFLILLSASSLYSQWQLATQEPYNNAYSAIDKDGYVYVATNNKDFFRYSPVDSSWALLQTNIEPEILYVNDDNELIRGMKEISADKGESWEPISFTDHEYSGFSTVYYKNIFLVPYFDLTTNLWKASVSTDGGHTWSDFELADAEHYYIYNRGIVAIKPDNDNNYKSYLFPSTGYNDKIELINEDGLIYNTLNSAYGIDSLGNLFIFDQYQDRTRCFRLEANNSWTLIDNEVRDYWTGSKISFSWRDKIYGDLCINGDRVYKLSYDGNGKPIFKNIFQWPLWPDDGLFIYDGYNGGTYNITFENNSYNIDLITGIWKSLIKGIPVGTITAMANDYEGYVYVATQAKGVYKSENGTDFYLINTMKYVESLIPLDTLIYSSASVSTGLGSELQCINYPEVVEPINITHINHYYTDRKRVVLSTDKGYDNPKYIVYSQNLTSNLPALCQVPDSLNVTALYTDSAKFAIAYDDNIVLITDEILKENGETTVTPSALTTIVSDQEGSLLGGSSNGLYKLENPVPSGKLLKTSVVKEWTPAGLDGHKINTLYNDITDSAFVIYAGTDDGVYYSTNNGASWEAYNTVSSKLAKKSETANKVTGFSVLGGSIYANIDNTLYKAPRVAYKGIATEDEPNIAPASFELKQNYPNPFNPVTNISFSLQKAAKVKLTVYDMLGREVETLVNMELGQGSYSYRFDGHNLSSGVYIYSLEAGPVRMAKKMMLIK